MDIEMTSLIENLWLADNLPIKDALHRSNGLSRAARIDSAVPGGLVLGESFDLDSFMSRNPELTTSIDITKEVSIPDGSGFLFCGEGSYGSEGFFGALNRHRRLAWVIYLEESNPFVEIAPEEGRARATSSSGAMILISLDNPDFHIA
jgi:hypothetical protein